MSNPVKSHYDHMEVSQNIANAVKVVNHNSGDTTSSLLVLIATMLEPIAHLAALQIETGFTTDEEPESSRREPE